MAGVKKSEIIQRHLVEAFTIFARLNKRIDDLKAENERLRTALRILSEQKQ